MTKKSALIWIGIILLALSSCAAGPSSDPSENRSGNRIPASSRASESSQPPISSRTPSSSTASSGTIINKAASNITFREGSAEDGKVILSSSDLIGFNTGDDTFDHSYKMIIFKLKESAKKSFSKETKRLAASEGTLSLWAGNERMDSATLSDPILGDTFVLSHLEEEQFDSICKKLKSAN